MPYRAGVGGFASGLAQADPFGRYMQLQTFRDDQELAERALQEADLRNRMLEEEARYLTGFEDIPVQQMISGAGIDVDPGMFGEQAFNPAYFQQFFGHSVVDAPLVTGESLARQEGLGAEADYTRSLTGVQDATAQGIAAETQHFQDMSPLLQAQQRLHNQLASLDVRQAADLNAHNRELYDRQVEEIDLGLREHRYYLDNIMPAEQQHRLNHLELETDMMKKNINLMEVERDNLISAGVSQSAIDQANANLINAQVELQNILNERERTINENMQGTMGMGFAPQDQWGAFGGDFGPQPMTLAPPPADGVYTGTDHPQFGPIFRYQDEDGNVWHSDQEGNWIHPGYLEGMIDPLAQPVLAPEELQELVGWNPEGDGVDISGLPYWNHAEYGPVYEDGTPVPEEMVGEEQGSWLGRLWGGGAGQHFGQVGDALRRYGITPEATPQPQPEVDPMAVSPELDPEFEPDPALDMPGLTPEITEEEVVPDVETVPEEATPLPAAPEEYQGDVSYAVDDIITAVTTQYQDATLNDVIRILEGLSEAQKQSTEEAYQVPFDEILAAIYDEDPSLGQREQRDVDAVMGMDLQPEAGPTPVDRPTTTLAGPPQETRGIPTHEEAFERPVGYEDRLPQVDLVDEALGTEEITEPGEVPTPEPGMAPQPTEQAEDMTPVEEPAEAALDDDLTFQAQGDPDADREIASYVRSILPNIVPQVAGQEGFAADMIASNLETVLVRDGTLNDIEELLYYLEAISPAIRDEFEEALPPGVTFDDIYSVIGG